LNARPSRERVEVVEHGEDGRIQSATATAATLPPRDGKN
jgi:hypothetical protein